MKVLNLFEVNLHQVLCLMFNWKSQNVQQSLQNLFVYKQPSKYESLNRRQVFVPLIKNRFEQFRISHHGPFIWNKIIVPDNSLNSIETFSLFKLKVKSQLLNFENLVDFFNGSWLL